MAGRSLENLQKRYNFSAAPGTGPKGPQPGGKHAPKGMGGKPRNTKKILGRSATVMLGKTSGLAGIAYWINNNYRLFENERLDKRDPLVIALKEWVDKEYEDGRQTALSNSELEKKIEELSGGKFKML